MSPKKIDIKVGQKYELASDQSMWKDDLSGVFLRAPGKYKLSRPKDVDYRSHLEWYASIKFKNPQEVLWKEDEGNPSFEVTKDMDTTNIKRALIKGTLVPKGKNKKLEERKDPKSYFRTDRQSGKIIYDGPNKNIYKLLNKNKVKETIETIKNIQDPGLLETIAEMEAKGWNPASAPRDAVMTAIEDQLKKNAIGLSKITEETEDEVTDLADMIKKNNEKDE